MVAGGRLTHEFALEVRDGVGQQEAIYLLCRLGLRPELRELVAVAPGAAAVEQHFISLLGGGEGDDEFAGVAKGFQ